MKYLPLKQTRVDALIKQCRHLNVFPLFLGFYYPKAEPGPHPVSDLLTELVEEAAGYLSIMTQEEVDSLVDSLPMYFQVYARREVVETSRKVALERTALGYLEALLQEQYFMIKDVVSDRVDESEVLKIYPELSTKFDNDGLLSLDNSFRLSDNGIAYKDHILHYHQFLRRGYGSNPNFDFLGKFIRFYYETKSRNRFRIAIDHRRIMPKEFFRQVGEKDSWFGPRFDKARLDDPTAVGLTVVLSNIPEGYRLFFPELDRTEFYWKYDSGIKTFEVEEVASKSYVLDSFYLNRYVHSERDTERRLLRHFDGAVKAYQQDSYGLRLTSQMPREPKCFKKVKVFRIDGDIPVDEWIKLIALFFKGNAMIIEYFDPEQYETMFKKDLSA